MNTVRKIFASALVLATIVAVSGVKTTNAAASNGDLIKMNGLQTVYYYSGGKRYVFPNQSTYMSWYTNFNGVKVVSQSELESYPLGANVTVRPGTYLVKITTNPTVYAVEPGGKLRSIVSEANAISLWGSNWAKKVIDVPDAFFTNYTIVSPLTAGVYPAGSLVKGTSADVYYFDGTNYRKFASESAFYANKFNFNFVNTAPTGMTFTPAGSDITGAEAALTDASNGASGTIGGTGLTVALASDTAPATTLVYGQSNANLASFNFSAATDGAVKVTTLKVKRIGVSSDALLSAVYLFDGNTRLTDSATVSSNYVTFNNPNGLFTVSAGSTKKVTVKSDISATTTDGSNVGVAIDSASAITASGATVTGSFPATGNIMGVSSATLATFAYNATTYPSTGNVDAGQTDTAVWKNTVTVGNRDVYLQSLRLRMIGSVASTDLQNLKLYVDSVAAGSTMSLGTDNYVTFDLTGSPVLMKTGSRTIEVRADIIGGSSKKYSFSVQQAIDTMVKDSQYDVYVKPTATPATSGEITVNEGSLTVTKKSDSPSGNITADASAVTLAKYEFKAYGEPIKVEYLKATVDSSDNNVGRLRNGAIYANGVQVGSTADLYEKDSVTGSTTYSLGSSLIVNPGSPVTVELKADIFDNDGTNSISDGDTLAGQLLVYTSGAQRMTSLGYINVPSATTAGNTLTVKVGAMSIAKLGTYGDQTTVIPRDNYKLGAFTVTGNGIESINLNTVQVDFTAGDQFTVGKLSDVYLKYNSKETTRKATVSATSNTWSINESLGKNDSMTFEVYGNIGTFTVAGGNDTMQTSMLLTGTTAGSGQTVYTNSNSVYAGQTITAGSGSIVSALDASTPTSKLVIERSTNDVANFKFTATNDTYTLTELVIKVQDNTNAPTVISNVILKDGTTTIASKPLSGTSVTFSGLSIPVPMSPSKVITAAVETGYVATGAGNTGANVGLTLDSFKANNSQGVEDATGTTDRVGNPMYAYKGTPTITNVSLPSSTLTTGTVTLAKFTVAANTNPITWKKMIFTVIKSTNPTIANGTSSTSLWDADTNTQVAGTSTAASLAGGAGTGSVTFVATNEQSVSGSKTYYLKATVGGSATTGDSISTSIGAATSYVAPNDYATVAGTSATFVWSDQAKQAHDETTLDWNNDFLVKNLPTDSQTLRY